jgi:hypothetical protein
VKTVAMDTVTRLINYQGAAAEAWMLVAMLKREGVDVDWSPPPRPSGPRDVQIVALQIAATGPVTAITEAASDFRGLAPRATVEVEGGDDDSSDADSDS